MQKILAMTILLAFFSSSTHAFLDNFNRLEDSFVIYAGEFERLDCPTSGKYDCFAWPANLLKLKYKQICISAASITACGRFGCKGLIVKPKTGEPELFTFDGTAVGVTAERTSIKSFKCPEMF